MALLNDLKKLLFGAKAVTESAVGRAVEAGREAAQNVADATGDLLHKAADKVENVGEAVLDKTGDLMEKAESWADHLGSKSSGGGSEEIMDDIIAETKTAPAPPAAEEPEETPLELPQLQATAPAAEALPLLEAPDAEEQPKLLEAPDEEPGLLESWKNTAASVGGAAVEKSSEMAGKAAEMARSVGVKVMETASPALEKFGEKATEVGGKVMETGSRVAEKFGEKATEVGEVLFEKSGEALESAKNLAAGLGSKIRSAADDLFQKAQEEAAKEGDADSLIAEAKNLGQKLEDKVTGNNAQFAGTTLDAGGSELNKHGGFWEKAERFAQGDYHNQGRQPKPGEMKIEQDPSFQKPEKGKVKGLDDADGDELIDDAVIDDGK